LLTGDAEIEGKLLDERNLYYLGTSRSEVRFGSRTGARLLLIGGLPFPEAILMWWNFVARTPDEIAEARTAWEERQGFGEVKAYSASLLIPIAILQMVAVAALINSSLIYRKEESCRQPLLLDESFYRDSSARQNWSWR
jgi:hypothetical protein